MKIHIIIITATLAITFGVYSIIESNNSLAVQTTTKPVKASTTSAPANQTLSAKPLDIVANPNAYLNKTIKMDATFDKFSTLGLDYKPAMRKYEDYISFLIRRDDVTDHVIPLSEMKLFLKRSVAEKYIDLESGDKINIEGKVFATALGDAWIDIEKFNIISSKKPINTK